MMESFVITISDDLDLFETKEAAEGYLEPWIIEPNNNFRAYRSNGNVLSPSIKTKSTFWIFKSQAVHLNQTEKIEPDKLRNELISYLSKLKPSDRDFFNSMDLQSLVNQLKQLKGFSK